MSEEAFERIGKLLEEQVRWTKFLATPHLREVFEKNVSTDEEKIVYELTDGERSTRDIEKIAKVGRTKVATLWKKWYKLSIMDKSTKYGGGRLKKSFSLSEVGIDVPTMPQTQEEASVQKTDGEFE